MPSSHTKISQTKKKRRTVNTVNNTPLKKQMKRLRSSDTDPETPILVEAESVEKMATEMEETQMKSTETAEYVLTDFMDKVDCSWEDIMQRLQQSALWTELETNLNRMQDEIDELSSENDSLKKRLVQTEGRLTRTEKRLDEANERILDLTSRSMRDNVVIKNVEESRGEDLQAKVMNIFRDKLKIKDAEMKEISIERIHRVGNPTNSRNRNIVAKLSSKGKTKVMTHLKNLPRDDRIKIHEQYPQEINTRRNKLWPQYIEARRANKEAKFVMDKLIIDKKVIMPPKDKISDINLNVTKRSLDLSSKHTAVSTSGNSHFQGHAVPISSTDDIIPAIRALCQDQRVAGSTHIVYAYRIGNEQKNVWNYEDDGEWGAGKEVMNVLHNADCFGHLVAVTRWHGGKNLGPDRFQMIRKTAEQAVSLL